MINLGIEPAKLVDEMLLQEMHSLTHYPRIFKTCLDRHVEPEQFLVDRGFYTEHRYTLLAAEAYNRNLQFTDHADDWRVYYGTDFMQNYMPTEEDILDSKCDITFRITNEDDLPLHYYGKEISNVDAIALLS